MLKFDVPSALPSSIFSLYEETQGGSMTLLRTYKAQYQNWNYFCSPSSLSFSLQQSYPKCPFYLWTLFTYLQPPVFVSDLIAFPFIIMGSALGLRMGRLVLFVTLRDCEPDSWHHMLSYPRFPSMVTSIAGFCSCWLNRTKNVNNWKYMLVLNS